MEYGFLQNAIFVNLGSLNTDYHDEFEGFD